MFVCDILNEEIVRDKMKVYIDNDYLEFDQNKIDKLKQLGYEVKETPTPDLEVIVSSRRKLINHTDNFKNLKFIQLTSAGYDFLETQPVKEKGILLANAKGVYSEAIGEFVVARLLQVYQGLRHLDQSQKAHVWDRNIDLLSLKNLKGAILGTGSIAKEVVKRLKAFGPNLDGYNTKGTHHQEFDACYPLDQFDQKSDQYDFIVITLPLNEVTQYYFDKARLNALKKECVLVNIARGPIIKESDLLEIMDTHLSAIVLDVFEQEPLDKKSPLWTHPKAYLSSHISFKNNFYKENIQSLIMDNLVKYIKQESLTNLVEL